ncbi:MAG: hypothetical protein A3E87_09555 [Gammaproteobacteria bacterium RIFCSPHIGHO2_12_FULL_35_23]|nr:MAG: hypothetical protein A3E87_09555 [Gammaproteobacteria bacterium RIFCSPHIGHO2_12_FULL_35_23]
MTKKTILVTRPDESGQTLCELLQATGFIPVYFPTLAIHPLDIDKTTTKNILAKAHLIIFTSPNAVKYGAALVSKGAQVVAIGPGTAKALAAYQLAVDFPEEFNSEGLLKHLSLTNLIQKNVVIIKGVGGRELLAEGLKALEATVQTIEVYRRDVPDQIMSDEILTQVSIIVVTSCEALINLLKMTPNRLRSKLKTKQLLVSSMRIKQQVEALTFIQEPLLAKNALNTTLISELERMTD